MPTESHLLMDGALHVYRRENSRYWQCSTYLGSRNHRQTTKEASLAAAKDFARDWYMERCVEDRQRRRGGVALLDSSVQPLIAGPGASTDGRRRQTPTGPSFEDAAKAFTSEFEIITLGERNPRYVSSKSEHVRIHLLPFFGNTALADITAGKVQEYRAHRQASRVDPKTGKPKKPARATLHSEMVTLRQILKTANRKGWIVALPDMTAPYKTSGKLEHRAWFSPEEYKMLYEATRERAKNPPKPRWREVCETFHDYVLFMGNTGLRPDESARLQLRDVKIVNDESSGERILEIEVRGKRGVGFCKSMPGAILPFERVRKRKNLKPTDPIFGKTPRELMNTVLGELNLKFDRDGHVRSCYSLRHTYICLRLLEGADIYQVAKNCRTSVEMIEKYYGRHLKNTIDAAAVNVRKPKLLKKTSSRSDG
ncbi:MAG: site-specific integrase [Blastomonas fulva]|jgi:integrase|uniref:site-specific integrase n=1 Tax=Blastomonas fulva TaxID=1550728 RepID=UPI000BCFE24A|nr:site-specific integrase [Blastomonas fulva]MDK2757045.1 site-specific integrase [Blastomonas fulva]MDZ4277493.1 site-specific integrase [Erythrobacter sp.]OYZ87567.1 MAG: integrase [Sphingomonadales bacterium 17-56-6]